MIRRKLLQWAGAAWRALRLPPIGENNDVDELASPIGSSASEASDARAARSPEYRDARATYDYIQVLRYTDPDAAEALERAFEADNVQLPGCHQDCGTPELERRAADGDYSAWLSLCAARARGLGCACRDTP